MYDARRDVYRSRAFTGRITYDTKLVGAKHRHRRSIVVEVCFWFAQRDVHWSRAFTGRITDDTKLVGATISCESTLKDGDAQKGSRQNAHVQSYAMATDQVQARTC